METSGRCCGLPGLELGMWLLERRMGRGGGTSGVRESWGAGGDSSIQEVTWRVACGSGGSHPGHKLFTEPLPRCPSGSCGALTCALMLEIQFVRTV